MGTLHASYECLSRCEVFTQDAVPQQPGDQIIVDDIREAVLQNGDIAVVLASSTRQVAQISRPLMDMGSDDNGNDLNVGYYLPSVRNCPAPCADEPSDIVRGRFACQARVGDHALRDYLL